MSWTIRDFDIEKDSGPGAALVTASTSSPLTEQLFRSRIENWPQGQPVMRRSVDCEGEFAAYLRIGQMSPNPKNAFMVSLFVDKRYRRQGIGGELLDLAIEFAGENKASALVTMTMESDTEGVGFSCNRGFEIAARLFDSYLDLTTYEPEQHNAARERVEADGYRIASLEEFELDMSIRRAVFDMFTTADKGTPGVEFYGLTPWETFNADVFESEDMPPESITIALCGDEFVGYSNVSKGGVTDSDKMYTGFTGVVPEHRGNGLAYAMKVKGIEYCIMQGAKSLKTENDTRNAPMLAVNRKLGFKEEQGEVMLVKELEAKA